jgi:menaquinone-specific isochorismate synthase
VSIAVDRRGALLPLRVRTAAVGQGLGGGLLDRLPSPDGGLAWVREGEGLVGWGEAARFEASGPGRFTAARDWWQELVSTWVVEDEVGAPGTGPVAFGSFAFADDGPTSSVLVVPRVVLGRRGGHTWLTTVGPAPGPTGSVPVRRPRGLRYSSGESSVTAFRDAVARAVGRIRAGELAKVVLAHDLLATAAEPIDARYVLARLAERYGVCWTFAVDGLVGATPELLVGRSGRTVTARVLAGTAPRGADPADDARRQAGLVASAKDREEHGYAVQSLAEALRPLSRTLHHDAVPYVLELSNVAHLATDVSAQLAADDHVLDLAGRLHPTAAVGGTPTAAATRVLRELEGMDRGRYAGPVGWVDARGDGEWGLALRCAHLDGPAARLFAGCGIVADSDPDAEVAEAQAKFVPVRDALEGLGA